MSIQIDLDQDRRVALLVVRGDLTKANAPAVTGAIAGLVANDGYDVVIDLTQAGTLLADGVRALRKGCDLAHENHRDVRFACPPSSPARPALVLAHLDQTNAVYDSRSDALRLA